jgi:sensor histidine kinase YesM
MKRQWYTNKWVAVSLHALFWILLFLSPYLLRPVTDNHTFSTLQRNTRGFFLLLFINNLVRLFLFYSNAYVFIPRLVYKKKYVQYLLVLLAFFFIMLVVDRFFFNLLLVGLKHRVWNFVVFNLFPFFFMIIASAAFRIIRDRIEENQRIKERETENLKTELAFLRSQVSPHFMFNVLNNMVALARKGSDQLEPSLIKLSSLLRYMLYETDENKVPLEKEVEYLQSYIDLQRQRFGKNVKINACFQRIESDYSIEPMLLIPFVENAFKHGTGLIENAEIDIELTAEKGLLSFSVRNKFNPGSIEIKDTASGIGLANVQRRLSLLYAQNHSLLISKQDNWFIVSLQLVLR